MEYDSSELPMGFRIHRQRPLNNDGCGQHANAE
jgi:hypothetical protein